MLESRGLKPPSLQRLPSRPQSPRKLPSSPVVKRELKKEEEKKKKGLSEKKIQDLLLVFVFVSSVICNFFVGNGELKYLFSFLFLFHSIEGSTAFLAHTKKRRDIWRLGTWRIGHHIYTCEKALRRWHPIFLFFCLSEYLLLQRTYSNNILCMFVHSVTTSLSLGPFLCVVGILGRVISFLNPSLLSSPPLCGCKKCGGRNHPIPPSPSPSPSLSPPKSLPPPTIQNGDFFYFLFCLGLTLSLNNFLSTLFLLFIPYFLSLCLYNSDFWVFFLFVFGVGPSRGGREGGGRPEKRVKKELEEIFRRFPSPSSLLPEERQLIYNHRHSKCVTNNPLSLSFVMGSVNWECNRESKEGARYFFCWFYKLSLPATLACITEKVIYNPHLPREISEGIAWKLTSQPPSLLSSLSLPLLQSLRGGQWGKGKGKGGLVSSENLQFQSLASRRGDEMKTFSSPSSTTRPSSPSPSPSLPEIRNRRHTQPDLVNKVNAPYQTTSLPSLPSPPPPSPTFPSSFQIPPLAVCLMGQEEEEKEGGEGEEKKRGKRKGEEKEEDVSPLTLRFYWNTKAEIAELAEGSEADSIDQKGWFGKSKDNIERQQQQQQQQQLQRRQYKFLNEYFLEKNEKKLQKVHQQQQLLTKLTKIAVNIKSCRGPKRDSELRKLLSGLKEEEVDGFTFPFSSSGFTAKQFVLDKCKTLDSARVPLWLTFASASLPPPSSTRTSPSSPSPSPPPSPSSPSPKNKKSIILKVGDDCRQDMFCLDLLDLFNRIWKEDRLPLCLTSYSCQVIGEMIAVIQVVPQAHTLAAINKQAGGALKVFSQNVLLDWLARMNPTPGGLGRARRRFMVSAAGYCVYTYLFGIADRHNDNVMMREDGRLVHIDYGHFLGNYKHRLGVNRERSPFVFTPQMMEVIGEEGSPEFLEFVDLCAKGYISIKKHFYLFLEMFRLMSYAGLPELRSLDDAQYLWKSFSPEISDEEARTKMAEMVKLSVRAWSRQVDDALHILAHQ